MRYKLLILATFFCLSAHGQAVSPVDSLKQLLKASRTADTTKTLVYEKLALLIMNSDPAAAMKYGEAGLALAKSIKYPVGQARNINRIGTILRANGSYDEALTRYLDGIKIAESINDDVSIIKAYNSIGILYGEQKDSKKAIEYYKKAKVLSEKTNNQLLTQILFLNIGLDFAELNQLDSALIYTKKSYELAEELNSDNLNVLLYNLGTIDDRRQRYESALAYYRKSVPLSIAIKDFRILGELYTEMALLFNAKKQRDSTVFYAEKGLYYAEETNNLNYISKTSILLSDIYEESDVKKSLQYLKESTAANDSLFTIEKATRLRQIEFNEQLRKQEKITTEQRNKTQKRTGILIGLAIGSLLLAVVFYRNNLQKTKNNALLAAKNEDIEHKRQALEASIEKMKKMQNQLIQSEKLASLGELTAGIAHEIQNPLNFVTNFSELNGELLDDLTELLTKENPSEDDKEEIKELQTELVGNQKKILEHGNRASSIVSGMLEHSRGNTGERREIDINRLCDEYIRLSFHGMRAKDKQFQADFTFDPDPNLTAFTGVGQDIGRVFLNLINNAFYAVNKKRLESDDTYKPHVLISTRNAENNTVEIMVKDNGIGMSEQVRAKIFQPFFTTKPTGEGTGLGLSLTYDIVTKGNGGTIDVSSKEGEGTTFSVKLPVT